MYKNAEKVLNEKSKVTKTTVRNAVAVTRIEQNVRRIHSMIHVIQPPSHDEVILPKVDKNAAHADDNEGDDEFNKSRSEENKMRMRLMKSAALVPTDAVKRPLDQDSIDRWMKKLNNALEPTNENKYANMRNRNSKKKKKEMVSQAQVLQIENKLCTAIRSEYRSRNGKKLGSISAAPSVDEEMVKAGKDAGISLLTNTGATATEIAKEVGTEIGHDIDISNIPDPDNIIEEKDKHFSSSQSPGEFNIPTSSHTNDNNHFTLTSTEAGSPAKKGFTLTTRQLLPYYRLESVHQFMDIFARVDENFSGDLDVNEWIRLFTSLNESIPVQEARMIFMKIDKDNDGFLTIRELIPVVFNKATKDQLRLIIQYAELELTKKIEIDNNPKVSTSDLEFLFEAYDVENVGFVDGALIKERIRNMRLSENALFFVLEIIGPELADDEMVNLTEFKRLFKPFCHSKK
jgi:hypothetical protein